MFFDVSVLFYVLFLLLYCLIPIFVQSTDHCLRVETQLQ